MPQLQFYPVDVASRTINQKPSIVLHGRTTAGAPITVVDQSYVAYFYVIPKEHDTTVLERDLKEYSVKLKTSTCAIVGVEKKKINLFERETVALKVHLTNPYGSLLLAQEIKKHPAVASVHEHDISFVQNYLIDRNIICGVITDVIGEIVNPHARSPLVRAQSVVQNDDVLFSPKTLSFDIETYAPHGSSSSPDTDPIIMISFHGQGYQKVITWKRFQTENPAIEFVESEYDLLVRFKQIILDMKPDFLIGYTSDMFSFPYIKKRAEKYDVVLDIGIDGSVADITKDGAYIRGITHLDLYRFISKVMHTKLESDSYRLKEVAQELLGEEKKAIAIDKLADIWSNHPDQLEPYCEYTLHDALLVHKLAMKLLPYLQEIVKITSIPFSDVIGSSYTHFAEAILMKESRIANEIIPEKPSMTDYAARRAVSFSSVSHPAKPGVYKNITIGDFSLLYPSIVVAHNISIGSLRCRCCTEIVPGEEMHFCKNVIGFIPKIIGNLLDRRKRIAVMRSESTGESLIARFEVLTQLAQSLSGAFNYYSSRWYHHECARAIVAYDVKYINQVIDAAKKAGFSIIGADTDSLFLHSSDSDKTKMQMFFESAQSEFPEKIEFVNKGMYPVGIFIGSKSGKNIQKKCALFSEEGFVKLIGFESSRRHLSAVAKETQEKVLYYILKEEVVGKAILYVRNIIADIRHNIVPLRKTIIYTQLQKDIMKYETIAPHVAVAQHMQQHGFTIAPGLIVKYIVSAGDGSIAERAKLPNEVDSYDSSYYVDNQIIPSVEKIFEAVGIDILKELEEKEQSNLAEYI